MPIERFDYWLHHPSCGYDCCGGGKAVMEPDEHGEFVRYTDLGPIVTEIADWVRAQREGGKMSNTLQVYDVMAAEILKRWLVL